MKSKIWVGVFLLGSILLLLSYISYSFAYGVAERIALDVGLGLTSLSTVFMAILLGHALISKEIENRTIHMIVTRSLGRKAFFLGKLLGVIAVLSINVIILMSMSFILYFLLGGHYSPLMLFSVLFSFFEATIVLLIVVFFSLITNATLTIIYGIVIYILGYVISSTLVLQYVEKNNFLATVINACYYIFPNFNRLNLKDYILYQKTIPMETLMMGTAYAFFYMLLVIVASLFIFENKNLD
ncbi:MAG: ABC transporter permease [Oligoflexia bacterium]|nr:ABC transporter permease [Oligoflexia bacterium]